MARAVRPRTVATYHGHLATFFRFLVKEGIMEASPMDGIAAPVARADQVQPFTQDQTKALLAAAKRSRHPKRDEAVILFPLDTGVRASELCGSKMRDISLHDRHTFTVNFLRAEGNQFTLKERLGHTDLKMTDRYLALAQADMEQQHRLYSPVESLLGRGGR